MATLDDVARIALALPEVTEGESRGTRTWSVGGKTLRVGKAVLEGGPEAVRRRDASG